MERVIKICWLLSVAYSLNAGSIYEGLSYVSEPVPVWADFTVRSGQILDFQSSDTTGRFSIEIPGVPGGAIIDRGVIALYGGMSARDSADSSAGVFVNGGWTSSAVLDYNGAGGSLGRSYGADAYSFFDYTGAGTLTGNWEVAYGWPGTDLTAFGDPLGPQTEIRKTASMQFWVQADVAVDYHFSPSPFRSFQTPAPVPEPATVGFSLAGLGLIAAGRLYRRG